jgi:hypothetical protein
VAQVRFWTYITAEIVERVKAKFLTVSAASLKAHRKERTKNRHDATTRPVILSNTKKPSDRLAWPLRH